MKHSFLNKLSLLAASASLLVAGLSFNNNVNKVSADEPIAPALQEGQNIIITAHYEKDSTIYDGVLTGVSGDYGTVAQYGDAISTSYPLAVEYGDLQPNGYQSIRLKSEDGYLYCGGSDAKLRVDSANDVDESKRCWICTGNFSDGYRFQNVGTTNRYLGFNYNNGNPRFGCYTTSGSYVLTLNVFSVELAELQNDLNCVDSYFGLGYSYEKADSYTEGQADVIDYSFINPEALTYGSWNKTNPNSNATYVGLGRIKSSTEHAIQLIHSTSSTSKHSGIVTTATGGLAKSVSVDWHSGTADNNSIEIYGKNEPYESYSDLYDSSKRGTSLGTIVKGTSTECVFSNDYKYIGIKATGNVVYLNSIEITWARYDFDSSDFRLKVGIEDKIENLNKEIEFNYGIEVSTSSQTKKYDFKANTPLLDETNYLMYQVIDLGDALAAANRNRLTDEFTIRAYALYDGNYIYSKLAKTYSLASLIAEYYGVESTKAAVTNMYDILVKLGAIVEA